jgi:hypothetical protein
MLLAEDYQHCGRIRKRLLCAGALATMDRYSQFDHIRERAQVEGEGELHQDRTNLRAEMEQGAL